MTQLIVCEKYRIAIAVAKALKATLNPAYGVYTNGDITVAYVHRGFIKPVSLDKAANGCLPFVPEKFKIAVTDKKRDRVLKPLFRNAKEVVFASDEGADAQARFFNICRHFRVGHPTSRMWLPRITRASIRRSFSKREKGRHLHNLAQSGLVAGAMDMMFEYNFAGVLKRWYYEGEPLTRKEVVAMQYLGDMDEQAAQYDAQPKAYRIFLDYGGLHLVSDQSWQSERVCAAIVDTIPVGEPVKARMTVTEEDAPAVRLHTMLTLQMDAFDNFGFMPSLTVRTAEKLYEQGFISSPYVTAPDAGNGITVLRRLSKRATKTERSLYRLIAGRMEVAAMPSEKKQYATVTAEITGLTFTCRWEVRKPKPEYPGTSEQTITIVEKMMAPVKEVSPISYGFVPTLANLTGYATLTADTTHPDMPYCHTVHQYGTALEGLMRKGFITIEDGTIACTPEGDRLLLDLAPYNLAHSILVGQYGADEIPYGTITGRKAVKGFGEWLTDTVTDILRYIPKNE